MYKNFANYIKFSELVFEPINFFSHLIGNIDIKQKLIKFDAGVIFSILFFLIMNIRLMIMTQITNPKQIITKKRKQIIVSL